jgi:hypothetical protein
MPRGSQHSDFATGHLNTWTWICQTRSVESVRRLHLSRGASWPSWGVEEFGPARLSLVPVGRGCPEYQQKQRRTDGSGQRRRGTRLPQWLGLGAPERNGHIPIIQLEFLMKCNWNGLAQGKD